MMTSNLYKSVELIQDETIRGFVTEVMNSIDTDVYYQIVPNYSAGDLSHYTESVVNQVSRLLFLFNLGEQINDVFIASALLHAIYMYEEGIDGWHSSDEARIGYIYNPLYQIAHRVRMQPFAKLISLDTYNDICGTIELQGGNASMYPQFSISLDDSVVAWILALAIHLAKTE
jgi:hypothetical protein